MGTSTNERVRDLEQLCKSKVQTNTLTSLKHLSQSEESYFVGSMVQYLSGFLAISLTSPPAGCLDLVGFKSSPVS